ncbi:phage holin family protein [Salipiger marinus]|jgi:TRAP-type C4-dicarboxylate transport system permease small subunit|uniref:Putative Holin-X, holin superfamily III n=1 Tax=Salipiger marinus TaxID=555512 RepID=A0A1G8TWT9_9RHOB|nr:MULTISPECIES: phage holin family protein [Salipiger]MEB3420666.1 phage holin family protein [Salipiger manganoxidans]SDJ45959.1 Putative Holin-X, holin superfamily III [Salipiger marinus]HBM57815.1 phage holin family protein [Citreicella sp.]HBT02040.1 phage holin family protein [Citreicella sp.]
MEPHKTESTTSLLSTIVDQLSALIRAELHLARSEVDQNLRRAGVALGMIVAAVVLLMTALNVLAAALSAGLAELGLDPGWAALIVGVAFAGIAWALLSKGLNDLKMSSLAPSRTAENVKRDARAVKGA